MERLESIPPGDVERAFAALGEALSWAVILEKTLESEGCLGKTFYRTGRDDDEDGYLVNGLRFARNQLHHDDSIAELLEVRDVYPATYGQFYGEWCWRSLAGDGDPGAPIYQRDMRGTVARETLRRVRPFFDRMVHEVEAGSSKT